MAYNWNNSEWRSGWYARKKYENKRRPLWILLGFMLRNIIAFVIWSLLHTN